LEYESNLADQIEKARGLVGIVMQEWQMHGCDEDVHPRQARLHEVVQEFSGRDAATLSLPPIDWLRIQKF
jgi:hypothetical protein